MPVPSIRKGHRACGPRSSKAGSAFGGGARQAFEGPLGAAAEGVADGTAVIPPCLSGSVVGFCWAFMPRGAPAGHGVCVFCVLLFAPTCLAKFLCPAGGRPSEAAVQGLQKGERAIR